MLDATITEVRIIQFYAAVANASAERRDRRTNYFKYRFHEAGRIFRSEVLVSCPVSLQPGAWPIAGRRLPTVADLGISLSINERLLTRTHYSRTESDSFVDLRMFDRQWPGTSVAKDAELEIMYRWHEASFPHCAPAEVLLCFELHATGPENPSSA